ncbi:MAG: 30S ribosomal protein S6 [Omnitrophica bacterium]|nr:30S ribosomal protein S6 [Candidatus Omnitrophota bacterium]
MATYEAMFIFKPNLTEEGQKELTAKLEKLLQENQAVLENSQVFGRRQLAYEIDKQKEGLYYLMNFSSGVSAVIPKLKYLCNIDENVLRILIVKKESKEAQR